MCSYSGVLSDMEAASSERSLFLVLNSSMTELVPMEFVVNGPVFNKPLGYETTKLCVSKSGRSSLLMYKCSCLY